MLAHKYVMKMGSNIFASLVSFVSLMVMTRYVGDEYGLMMWGWSFVAMFNAVTDMGFNLTNVKFVSEGRDPDKCFSTYLTIKLCMGATMVILSLVSAYVSFVFTHSMNSEAFMVVMVFVLYYLVWDLQTVMTYTLDGRGENGKTSLISMIEFLSRAIILIILALSQVTAIVLSMGYVVGICISVLSCVVLFRKARPRLCRPDYLRDYVMFTAPIAVSMLMVTAVEYMDKVIIGFSFDSREVGYYTAAAGVIWTFANLGKSLNTVMLPQLSKYHDAENGKEEVRRIVWGTERYLAMISFPVMVFLMLFGSEIAIVLFGSGYERSGDVLSVQCFVLYSTIVSALMTQILYSTNHSGAYGRCSAVYVVVVLVCFLTLIPAYGAGLGSVGAGASMAIGYLVQALILVYTVQKKTGIGFYSRIWRHFVAAAVDIAILLTINHFLDVSGFFPLVLLALFCLCMHIGLCWVLREFRRDDLIFIKDALDPRKLSQSIREEMR